MKYGVAFYVFDTDCRLLLIKKHYGKPWARSDKTGEFLWLVPGTTTGIPTNMQELIKDKSKALKLLAKDLPLYEADVDRYRLVGSWVYSVEEPERGEYNFQNFVINFRNLGPDELEDRGKTALSQPGTDVKEIGFFHILNLPKDISPLTGGFLRSLLFHKLDVIPTRIGKAGLEEFNKLLGDESNKYFLYDRANPGGYGDVYLALDIASLSPVAIKIARPNTNDPKWIDRFIVEGTTLLSLLSADLDESVEKIFSINRIVTEETQKRYYLVKNLVKGTTLQDMNLANLDDKMIIEIMKRIFKTLHVFHSRKHRICHRDLKPNNIMLSLEDKIIKTLTIIDFGLCKNEQILIGTSSGFLTGNPIYQSKNTVRSYNMSNEIDDYYSVLHVFYWLIFNGSTFYEEPPEQVKRDKIKGVDKFLDLTWLEKQAPVDDLENSFKLFRKILIIISRYYAKKAKIRNTQKAVNKTVEEIQVLL